VRDGLEPAHRFENTRSIVRPIDQNCDEASERGEKEMNVELHCLLFHISGHAIELCFPRLVCVSISRGSGSGHHGKLTDMRYRMWPCLMVSSHAPREQNNPTHNVSHFTMLLKFTPRKVNQLLSSRRRCFCHPLMLGRGNFERSKNLDQAHTVNSAYNISPQRQNSASLQELQTPLSEKACPDLWR
jgi:hypothetical protein